MALTSLETTKRATIHVELLRRIEGGYEALFEEGPEKGFGRVFFRDSTGTPLLTLDNIEQEEFDRTLSNIGCRRVDSRTFASPSFAGPLPPW